MNMLKGLLLGSAVMLAALTGTQAADLPVKAKPVEYVKICTLYGRPSTTSRAPTPAFASADISAPRCRFSAVATATSRGSSAMASPPGRAIATSSSRAAAVYLNVDTRTQTSFGTLRTFSVVRARD